MVYVAASIFAASGFAAAAYLGVNDHYWLAFFCLLVVGSIHAKAD